MSAQRITFNNFIRNGHRFAPLYQAPFQAQNEPHNEEQNECGKFAETTLPLFNLVAHRSDSAHFTPSLVPPQWPITNVFSDREGRLRCLYNKEISKHGLKLPRPLKKNTAEVSVQTELSEEENSSAKRFEKYELDIENEIAVKLMKDGLTTEAVKHFLHASENGHIEAMNNLADCLYNGRGAKENKREALRLWKQAATCGQNAAMYNLAVCYIGGEGTGVDEQEGLKWMWFAANSGNSDASFYLILKSIHEGNNEHIRSLVKQALVDPEYHIEICSWIRDGVVDESYLCILRDELGMT